MLLHTVDLFVLIGYTIYQNKETGGIGHGKHCISPEDGYVPFPYPEIKKRAEDVYAKNGLTLTQALNIFIQQSINAGGFPFQVNEENVELIKARAMERLMKELETGENSGDLVDETEVYRQLGVSEL